MNRRNAAGIGAVNGKKHNNKGSVCDKTGLSNKEAEGNKIPRPVSRNILTKSMKILGCKKALAVRVNGVTEAVPAVAEARPVAVVQPQVQLPQVVEVEERDEAAGADGPFFDVDLADLNNPQLCAEYVKEIYQ